MRRLNPEKLRVKFLSGAKPESPIVPRRYTLTHSDLTGNLFLSIGCDYNLRQISGWYSKFMRDEVLAEWKFKRDEYSLHVHLHVSGGFVFGRASWRDAIFRRELPLVLEAIRYGDRNLFTANSQLGHARIWVHF
jgi:hypothetical protein